MIAMYDNGAKLSNFVLIDWEALAAEPAFPLCVVPVIEGLEASSASDDELSATVFEFGLSFFLLI